MPGDIITFGIDLMIDTLRFLGISVVDAAKTAEQLMALSIYLVGGIFAGLVYFGVMRARKIQSSQNTGLLVITSYSIHYTKLYECGGIARLPAGHGGGGEHQGGECRTGRHVC